ncbi:very short patch repair endonuclease [Halomonas aquatica]|uniref:Very short patch repair endonuclease n=1 Tax=Halomonas aquatica TaxID=3151123 RepID=A0ABV1NB68_9GAMM
MLTPEQRSYCMSRIQSKNTKPEIVIRRFLHAAGFRFRLHKKGLPGKPDLVLPKHRLAIFVHGCFWHRHRDCFYATTPHARPEFWKAKFDANVMRDERNRKELSDLGWRVLVVWECGFKHCKDELSDIPVMITAVNQYQEWPPEPPRSQAD